MSLRIVDARTGRDVRVGEWVPIVSETFDGKTGETLGIEDESYRVLKIDQGLFSAKVKAQRANGMVFERKLPIRHAHPNFFLQRVLFIPT